MHRDTFRDMSGYRLSRRQRCKDYGQHFLSHLPRLKIYSENPAASAIVRVLDLLRSLWRHSQKNVLI